MEGFGILSKHAAGGDELQDRRHYIWREWVEKLGLPIGAVLVATIALDYKFSTAEMLTGRFFFMVAVTFGSCIAAAWLLGDITWRRRTRQGHKNHE